MLPAGAAAYGPSRRNATPRRGQIYLRRDGSAAERRADGLGELPCERVDLLAVLALDHDADDGLRARRAQHDSASGPQLRLGATDGRLRVADINPNTAGVKAIAEALGFNTKPVFELDGNIRGVLALGDVLPGIDPVRLKDLEYVALSAHERGPVPHAKVALPVADWAEVSGTVTNNKGLVQRMHAAFGSPGQALPAWEAIVRLASATPPAFVATGFRRSGATRPRPE